MKKEEIRKEFFKLKLKGFSYSQCKKILGGRFEYDISKRTLKRWVKRLDTGNWNLLDKSRRPHTIQIKLTQELENQVISLRNNTGWGERKIAQFVNLGHTTINKILSRHKLVELRSHRKKRIK